MNVSMQMSLQINKIKVRKRQITGLYFGKNEQCYTNGHRRIDFRSFKRLQVISVEGGGKKGEWQKSEPTCAI